MNKFIILIFSFFLFALVNGCSKNDEDKCKDKGKYWDASAEVCKEKASDGEGPAATTGTAVEIAKGETQESCKSKQEYVWSLDITQCKKVDYFMFIRSSDELFRVIAVLKKDGVFDMQKEINLSKNECV